MSSDYLKDLEDVWKGAELEIAANRKVAENHQLGAEEVIGNITALKNLNNTDIEEAVKNL